MIIILVFILLFILYYIPFGHYFYAKRYGINISIGYLYGMRIRKTPIKIILEAMIEASHATIHEVTIKDLETLSLVGGDPLVVVKAMVMAKNKGEEMSFNEATGSHLSGVNLLEKYKQ